MKRKTRDSGEDGGHVRPAAGNQLLERILVPGGPGNLTLAALERKCHARLAEIAARSLIWRWEGHGRDWTIGDFTILIIETTAAPDAVLYVQFWSEPEEPVCWEVCSGRSNPGARRFVDGEPEQHIRAMGFEIGGEASNFRKRVTVANRGDAAAIARDVLRVFHDAFGYRGASPLVAKLHRCERVEPKLVLSSVRPEDAQKLLWHLGFEAELAPGERPVITARRGGFGFAATLDVPTGSDGRYRCLDLTAAGGQMTGGQDISWLNKLNQRSRVARAWVENDGTVAVGTSLIFTGGLTEEAIANQVAGWEHAATKLSRPRSPSGCGGRRGSKAARKAGRRGLDVVH